MIEGKDRKPIKKRQAPHHQDPLKRKDCRRFLEYLALGHPVSICAKHARLSVSRLYDLKDQHEPFEKAWKTAYIAGTDVYEEEARRRAVEGIDKPLYHQGERVTEKIGGRKQKVSLKEYSDTLLMFLAKSRDRMRFEGASVKIVTPEGDETAPGEIPRDVPLIGIYLQSPTTFVRPPEPKRG